MDDLRSEHSHEPDSKTDLVGVLRPSTAAKASPAIALASLRLAEPNHQQQDRTARPTAASSAHPFRPPDNASNSDSPPDLVSVSDRNSDRDSDSDSPPDLHTDSESDSDWADSNSPTSTLQTRIDGGRAGAMLTPLGACNMFVAACPLNTHVQVMRLC